MLKKQLLSCTFIVLAFLLYTDLTFAGSKFPQKITICIYNTTSIRASAGFLLSSTIRKAPILSTDGSPSQCVSKQFKHGPKKVSFKIFTAGTNKTTLGIRDTSCSFLSYLRVSETMSGDSFTSTHDFENRKFIKLNKPQEEWAFDLRKEADQGDKKVFRIYCRHYA